jgi:WD40 repeat protein
MIRWSLASVLLGALIASAAIYFIGWPQDPPTARQIRTLRAGESAPADGPAAPSEKKTDPGERLQVALHQQPLDILPQPVVATTDKGLEIVISDCRLVPKNTAEIPSKREGTLLFTGTQVSPFDPNHSEYRQLFSTLPDGRPEFVGDKDKYFSADLPVVAVRATDKDNVTPQDRAFPPVNDEKGDKATVVYRRWRTGDDLKLQKPQIYLEKQWFKPLSKTDKVRKGDLLAVVDPALVFEELKNKAAALEAKEADWKATIAIRNEAQNHYNHLEELRRKSPGAVATEEVESALMNYERYTSEAVSKQGLYKVGEKELSQVITTLNMHFIRAEFDGTVMEFYKKDGEAVKNLEQVLQLHNLNRLVVEGQIGVQYLPYLRKGMPVTVEPTTQQAHMQILHGHPFEINGVAVNNDLKDPHIVSVSEDGSIRVWARDPKAPGRFKEVDKLVEPADGKPVFARAVKCVACSPVGSGENLCITGDNDGSVTLWDLSRKGSDAFVDSWKAHKNSIVTCVAFHPSGKYFASGGEDRKIWFWQKTQDGWKKSYDFPEAQGHKGGVTWIQFAADKSELISAGNDKQILHWDVTDKKAKLRSHVEHRSGEVTTLSVSPDGNEVLFDRGRELHVLSLEHQRRDAVIQNPTGSASFNALALFSPDGRMVLTGQGPDVRLQLWHLPAENDTGRAFEMRQLVWSGAPTTCAAFSPHAEASQGLLVTGTRDGRVVVWPLPSHAEVNQPLVTTISAIGQALSPATRDVLIQAEVENTAAHPLVSGNSATMVIKP